MGKEKEDEELYAELQNSKVSGLPRTKNVNSVYRVSSQCEGSTR